MSLIDLFMQRASPELPSSDLQDPANWLMDSFGAQRTHTGRTLTKKGSEALPVVWGCVNLISQDIGKLPIDAYRRLPNGGREKAPDTPQHRLLRIRPNSEQTPSQFKTMLQSHILGWGNAYAEIEREDPEDFRSPPVALWPLLPDRTRARRVDGFKVLETKVKTAAGRMKPVIFLPGEYLHIPGRGFDGLAGYSPLTFAKQSIALGLAEEEWLARFYDGDATMAGWVSVPNTPVGPGGETKRQVIRDSIRGQHGGLTRSHRIGILWDGAEWQPGGVSPQDQQLVSAMEFNGYQICRFFRVAPHKVQLMAQATFTNIEHQGLEHVTDTLMPWTRIWQEVCDWELWPEQQRGQFFFDWNFRDLLRGDAKAEAEAIRIGVGGGWISRAEARQLQNRNPADADQGLDEFLVQVNQVPAKVLAAMVPQNGSGEIARSFYRRAFGLPEEPQQLPAVITTSEERRTESRAARSASGRNRLRIAHQPIFQRSAERYVSAEARAAQRALDRSEDDLVEFGRRISRFYEGFPPAIRRELAPVMATFGAVIADAISEELSLPVAGPSFDVMVEAVTESAVHRHIGKSQRQIEGVVKDSDSVEGAREALAARFAAWVDRRPPKIALAESVRAGSRLAQEAYAAAGIQNKIWVTFGDACPLCQEMNGRVVGVSGTFLAPGDTVDPGQEGVEPLTIDRNTRHAPLHGGCDCTIAAA